MPEAKVRVLRTSTNLNICFYFILVVPTFAAIHCLSRPNCVYHTTRRFSTRQICNEKEKKQKTEIRTNRFETSHTIFMNILKMFLNCQVGRNGASAGFWYKRPNRINKYQFSEIVWHRYTQICINLSLERRVMELSS